MIFIMEKEIDRKKLELLAARIRLESIRAMHASGGGHVGGCMSIAEVLAVLYGGIMHYNPENPKAEPRDKLVLSKGHCGPALYAALALSGFFPLEELLTLNKNGTRLPSHCDMRKTPGIDMTTGSLGQGASTAAGLALGKKMKSEPGNVFLILGDGECDEGQVWEMVMFAKQRRLDNLITFVDLNHQQLDGYTEDICSMGGLCGRFTSFGWESCIINGNDVCAVYDAAAKAVLRHSGSPSCIVLDTVKGKGWSLTEGKTGIHHMAVTDGMMAEAEKEFAFAFDKSVT